MNLCERQTALISPYGGNLVELRVPVEEFHDLMRRASELPAVQLTARECCDLELLATGAFSPLDRFMNQADYTRVVEEMRLSDGTLFPIPITLAVPSIDGFKAGQEIALRSPTNHLLGVMLLEEVFERDLKCEAVQVCATDDEEHPLYVEMSRWHKYCLSGPLKVLALPKHFDFPELRRTPAQVRALLEEMENPNVVAFQTRNPMHRAHEEMTKRAIASNDATLLIHPVVGLTKPGDVDHYTRVRTYKMLVEKYFDHNRCLLSLLPLAMRMAGPREAIWHAIIRRNFGANHFIIGRDHAGPGKNSQGKPFYTPYEARDTLVRYCDEIGVRPLPCDEMVYVQDDDCYEQISAVAPGARVKTLSGTEVRQSYLEQSIPLPGWFTRPETATILAGAYPPRWRQGFCLWFTGLPSSGKSTVAETVTVMMLEYGRQVTLLDGDVVRTHLSKGLTFSREDRDANILRIGFVASEISRQHGAVICAAVSPYRHTRNQVRHMMGEGSFIEIFVDTPISVCEMRDVKKFYARAQARSKALLASTIRTKRHCPLKSPSRQSRRLRNKTPRSS